MAGNKFATMLDRNTSRLTVILVYTILEWVLIFLLLLNSFFSYLIFKFAAFFGLKPPCPLCSRVDHVIEKDGCASSYIDEVCENHAKEISRLGYCLNHGRLVEACQTCEDCTLARACSQGTLIACVSLVTNLAEGEEKELNCSCCGAAINDGFYSKYFLKDGLLRPSLDFLEYSHDGIPVGEQQEREEDQEEELTEEKGQGILVVVEGEDDDDANNDYEEEEEEDKDGDEEVEVEEEEEDDDDDVDDDDHDGCDSLREKDDSGEEEVVVVVKRDSEMEKAVDESFEKAEERVVVSAIEDASCDVMGMNLDDFVDDQRVIPVELIDSIAEEDLMKYKERAVKESDGVNSHLMDDLDVYFQNSSLHTEAHVYSRDYLSVLDLEIPVPKKFFLSYVVKDYEGSRASRPKTSDTSDESSGTDAFQQIDGVDEMEVPVRVSPRKDDQINAPEIKEIIGIEETSLSFHSEGIIHVERSNEMQRTEPISSFTTLYDEKGDAQENIIGDVLLHSKEELGSEQPKESTIDSHEISVSCHMRSMSLHDNVVVPEEPVDEFEDIELTPSSASLHDDDNDNEHEDVVANVLQNEEDQVLGQTKDSTVDDECFVAKNSVASDVARYQDHELGLEQLNEGPINGADGGPVAVSETLSLIEKMDERMKQMSLGSEFNEILEEKAFETPYIESIHTLHKRLIERKDSGLESLDGSIGEGEGGEAVLIERLKSALKAERVALSDLYAELEEERSASAIAANQTMAMITRLQEEKAAMQMEALQYQRMMEEQSEYDQDALQHMNELVVKREKEKHELEKELELYRKNLWKYRASERRMRKMKAIENGGIGEVSDHQDGRRLMSPASSPRGDSDGVSVDYKDGDEDDASDCLSESNHNASTDAVMNSSHGPESHKELMTLDESLADFEEERFLILEQLRALEEKLFILSDEESKMTLQHITDDHGVVPPENSSETEIQDGSVAEVYYTGTSSKSESHDEADLVINGTPDGLFSKGKHPPDRKYVGPKPKRLLPLFDASSRVNGSEEQKEDGSFSHSDVHHNHKHTAIEEEIEQVYERLQVLEADKEFLKHSINSLKKGDKGIALLQEILQLLRDLRAVELRARGW